MDNVQAQLQICVRSKKDSVATQEALKYFLAAFKTLVPKTDLNLDGGDDDTEVPPQPVAQQKGITFKPVPAVTPPPYKFVTAGARPQRVEEAKQQQISFTKAKVAVKQPLPQPAKTKVPVQHQPSQIDKSKQIPILTKAPPATIEAATKSTQPPSQSSKSEKVVDQPLSRSAEAEEQEHESPSQHSEEEEVVLEPSSQHGEHEKPKQPWLTQHAKVKKHVLQPSSQHSEHEEDMEHSPSRSAESDHEDNTQSLPPVQVEGEDAIMAIEANPENPDVDSDQGGA